MVMSKWALVMCIGKTKRDDGMMTGIGWALEKQWQGTEGWVWPCEGWLRSQQAGESSQILAGRRRTLLHGESSGSTNEWAGLCFSRVNQLEKENGDKERERRRRREKKET